MDPTTGDARSLGPPTRLVQNGVSYHCAGQGTYNPTTGESLFVAWGDSTWIARADLRTGNVKLLSEQPLNSCAITADASGTVFQVRSTDRMLQRVDSHSGATIDEVPLAAEVSWCAFAMNPRTGHLASFASNGDGVRRDIVEIDPATGAVLKRTPLRTDRLTGVSEFCPGSLAIDPNGIAWVQDDCYMPHHGIVAVDLRTGEAWPMADGVRDVERAVYSVTDRFANTGDPRGSFYQVSMWVAPTVGQLAVDQGTPVAEPTAQSQPTVLAAGPSLNSALALLGLLVLVGLCVWLVSRQRRDAAAE
ncbi:MAG TPA: hypothetical protein VK139_00925 [Microbacteriaceae bacterium]|nr:hypothetical protein [Microbacteriaceae bacterium]